MVSLGMGRGLSQWIIRLKAEALAHRGSFREACIFPTTIRARGPGPIARRPCNALLQPGPSILLRRRFACQVDVPLHSRSRRRHRPAQGPARRAGCLPRGHRSLSRRPRRCLRVPLLLVLARRPVPRAEHRLRAGPRPLHEGHPRRQIQERPHRFPQDRPAPARRQPARQLCLPQGTA